LSYTETPPPEKQAPPFFVTTAPDPPPWMLQRALAVAARCGAPFLPRDRGLPRLRALAGLDLAYVVRREREELQSPTHTLFLHPGLFYLKRKDKLTHPLLRALSPSGEAPGVVVDATMGQGGDALHVAGVLRPARLIGIEASPALYSLLESGLPRLAAEGRAWSEGASRIELREGDAASHLRALGPESVDVVYLDPMFEAPLRSTEPFDLLLRQVARHAPLDAALLEAAVAAARWRVVLKLPGMAPPPIEAPAGSPGWNRRVRGGAVDYAVIDKVAG
jgi:hypothetical protein